MSVTVLTKRIKEARKRFGLTQKETADALGITLRHYQRLEPNEVKHPTSEVTYEMLTKMSRLFGKNTEYFTEEKEEEKNMKFKFNVGQKVRILDGSDIYDYECSWNPRMSSDVGRIVTIIKQLDDRSRPAYRVEETDWSYDERGLKAVEDTVAPGIIRVIFNNPATIVLWEDGTKTVVKAYREDFDPEKGLAMCFMKKALGNRSAYNKTLKELTKDIPTGEKITPSPKPSSHHKDVDWIVVSSPNESGWYIGITKSGYETDIHYSAVHKAWNVFDEQSKESVDRYHINVFAWRPMDDDLS